MSSAGDATLHTEDVALVRAAAPAVHDRLVDPLRWSAWWPGVRVQPSSFGGGVGPSLVALEVGRWRQLRLAVRPYHPRPGRGVVLDLRGDLRGRAEFWLEPVDGGVLVHHLLTATTPLAAGDRVAGWYRRAVRRGLWGLRDHLHDEVRFTMGLAP